MKNQSILALDWSTAPILGLECVSTLIFLLTSCLAVGGAVYLLLENRGTKLGARKELRHQQDEAIFKKVCKKAQLVELSRC